MNLVKNRLDYCMWSGKRSYKVPDEWDNHRGVLIKGEEREEDGIVAFATANQFVLVPNFNSG